MLLDSHCHLASHRYQAEEVESLIERAKSAGVTHMVTLATSLEDAPINLQIAENPAVHACVGIHPCDVHNAPDDAVERLAKFVNDPRVCAIGETGLDYYHPAPDGWEEEKFRKRQQDFLRQHFELAAASKLNIVIHTRDAKGSASFEDAMKIYESYRSSVRAVFHCFIGAWENAKRVIDFGGLVSFGGVLTFKSASETLATAARCPAGTLMLETDSPYLAPEPFRGKRNEPARVREIAERLAAERGESLEQLARHTSQTAATFFRFRPACLE